MVVNSSIQMMAKPLVQWQFLKHLETAIYHGWMVVNSSIQMMAKSVVVIKSIINWNLPWLHSGELHYFQVRCNSPNNCHWAKGLTITCKWCNWCNLLPSSHGLHLGPNAVKLFASIYQGWIVVNCSIQMMAKPVEVTKTIRNCNVPWLDGGELHYFQAMVKPFFQP